ncbi:MAG: hypothetical protein ACSLFQ_22680 [Thermoanaerobaculia bacterium]
MTDADGNVVRGLTKDDFDLYEGGKLQAITNFSAIDPSRDESVVPGDDASLHEARHRRNRSLA